MDIIVDTREKAQEWKRIQGQFDRLGVRYYRSKLFVGDYQSLDNARLVVDRKKDLLELAGNVCQQHERFRAELARAKEAGIKLIILVEHGDDVRMLTDVYFWENPRLKETAIRMVEGRPRRVVKNPRAVSGKTLLKALVTIRDRYNVQFVFCNKRQTGTRIVELLGGGSSE